MSTPEFGAPRRGAQRFFFREEIRERGNLELDSLDSDRLDFERSDPGHQFRLQSLLILTQFEISSHEQHSTT